MTKSTTLGKSAETTVLVVRLGTTLLALPIEWVEEVLPALPIESVPQCPSFVRGVVFVRGHLIPVLSAAERLGMVNHERPDEPHIVCLNRNGRLIGVEFDEALDLMNLNMDECLTAGQLGAESGFMQGLVDRDGLVIRVLDPEKLIANEEMSALQDLPQILKTN
ncbi:MAG TPA: chemotaxis protein CheW [Planctomycetaceae bacterium]|nr:chemotaxis protein CheW [Planctomycetaceae bacterium]HQZ63996.1 chemotaxis protein CheW [Planctomycetaceae bacterium]